MTRFSLLLVGSLFGLAACRQEPAPPPPPPPPPEPVVEAAPEPAEVTLKDVGDTAGAYAAQQLDALKVKFAELKVKAAAKGEEAEAAFAELKADFDAKLTEAEAKLAAFKEANAPRAEQLKEDLSETLGEVGTIFRDAWSRYGGDPEAETPAPESP